MRAAMLIHGFATHRADFARLVPLLSTRYDEIWCADLPGHGAKVRGAINANDIVNKVFSAFDDLSRRHQKIDVFGFSMGGALATMLASSRSVNRLILLAPANKYLAPLFLFSTIKSMCGARREGRKRRKGKLKGLPRYTLSAREIRQDIGGAIRLFKGIVVRYTPANLVRFAKVISRCNKSLRDINAPTLILWGKMDQLVRFSSIKHIAKRCQNVAKIKVYPDVSHMMLYSRVYPQIIDEIMQFLLATDPPKLNPSQNTM